jgi:BMFP domain-containing protein YqiC
MEDRNPFAEMAKMWGDLGPQLLGMWSHTVEQVMEQSAEFRSQVDNAVAATLRSWGLPSRADQGAVADSLARLNEKIDLLATRVEVLERELAIQQKTPKDGRADQSTKSESR